MEGARSNPGALLFCSPPALPVTATLLGLLFALGAVGSAAVAYFQGATLLGTVTKATTVSFLLLAVLAFVI